MRHTLAGFSLALTLTSALGAQTFGSFVTSGTGCPAGTQPSIYELFDQNTFDLNGSGLTFTPSANGYYDVAPGGAPLPYGPTTSLPTFSGDDTIRGPLFLPFTFPFFDGSGQTIAVDVASNGYVYLVPGEILDTRCCDGEANLEDFHEQAPSIAALGTDLDASAATGTGDIWFDADPTAAWITWDQVEEDFAPSGVTNTFQVQLYPDGSFTIYWMDAGNVTDDALVGFSPGDGAPDNGPVDLSSAPIPSTGIFGTEPVLRGDFGLPTIGQTYTVFLDGMPDNTSLAAMLLGAFQLNSPLDVIGAETCSLLTAADILNAPMPVTPPTTSLALPIASDPSGVGLVIEMQAAIVAPGLTTLGLLTSNRGSLTIGDTPPITVRAIGTNSFNGSTASGFWNIENTSTLDIVSIEFDWTTSSVPSQQNQTFDTDQSGMNDLFMGGNSLLADCMGTYRNSSDVTVGLDYAASMVSPCDATAMTGWIGLNASGGTNDYRTLLFTFTDFNPGELFEFDADTDGSGFDGGSMAGLVVTASFSDGSARSGELQFVSNTESRLDL